MKADKLDYTDRKVIIDRIFADFEGYETQEIPKIIPETIYEEQEINQLVGLQATIITMINQFLVWRENLESINLRLNFYFQELKNSEELKISYFKVLNKENTSILRIYRELVVLQNIILALKKILNLAYGQETTNIIEVEIKNIQNYYTKYNDIVDDILKISKKDGKIEAEKITLKKPIYKKDFQRFMDRVKDKRMYLKSYSTITDGLLELVNVG